jgi:hypothetical protein
MKNIFAFIIFFASLSVHAQAEKFRLYSDPKKYTKEQYVGIIHFMESVESLMPAKMKAVIARPIFIDFADLGSVVNIYPECDLSVESLKKKSDTAILGHLENGLFTNGKKIPGVRINRGLLNDIYAGPVKAKTFTCGHKNSYQLAQATVLHELAHLYDFMEEKIGEEAQIANTCITMGQEDRQRDAQCRFQEANRKTISGTLSFLNNSGWTEKGFIIKKRRNLNQALDRSPDIYEFKNPMEAFAVNFEYFIMDPDYKCRRPTLYAELARHFGYDPQPSSTCAPSTTVYLSTPEMDPKADYSVNIDPSRIYEIDYLFASEGEAMMSRWGHSMYRLVLCAPGKPVGPSCRLDLAYHVVVSYRAMVNDLQIDSSKGLKGDYPSRLFMLKMNDTIDEYTKDELRNIISLPLKLSAEEKTAFIKRVLEQYWSYRGSYYFLSNNCATESMSLIYACKQDMSFQTMTVSSPLDLYNQFIKKGLMNPALLGDKKFAKERGYFFPAQSEKLYKAFAVVQAEGPAKFKSYKDARDYLFNSRASDRAAAFNAVGSIPNRTQQRRLTAYLIQLEEHIQRVVEKQFGKVVADRFAKAEKENFSKEKAMSEEAKKIMRLGETILPENRTDKGYGVPLKQEIRPMSDSDRKYIGDSMIKLTEGIRVWAFAEFPNEIAEMKQVMENRNSLAKKLIELSKSQ